jgi:TonB family protein
MRCSSWLIRINCPTMSRYSFLRWTPALVIGLSLAVAESSAQTSVSSEAPQDGAALTKLSQPVYPPLARQTRIAGDVVILLGIRTDGTVESAAVNSGHPLLKQAALDSAQKSQFQCRKCSDPVTTYRLVYTFQLVGPTDCCKATERSANDTQADQPVPRIVQSQNHVTVIDRPVCVCDIYDPALIKVRSLKCLYLWRCGLRYSL